MNEKEQKAYPLEASIRETSEEMAWEAPTYLVVDTALEVTAYALRDH